MINARHPSTSLPADLPTLGVEEEFLIVDPNSGSPLPVAQEVIDLARRFGTELEPELTRVQLTSNTPVCHGMRELREHLLGTRSVAAAAALQTGGQLLAVGVFPAGPTAGRSAMPTATSAWAGVTGCWPPSTACAAATCTSPCPTGRPLYRWATTCGRGCPPCWR